jgi:hypothetical protein
MFGQIRVEFVFGIIIFALIMFFIVTQTNTLFSSLLTDSRTDAVKAKASNAIKILIEDRGDPPDWDTIAQSNPGNVKRVGLTYYYQPSNISQPYNLSRNKILNLSSNCSLLNNFDLKAYRLKVYNSTQQILFCGFDSLEPVTVMETRYIFVDGDFGRITLELW